MFSLKSNKQPWLYSKTIEFVFIILPPFICLFLICCFPKYFVGNKELSDYTWVILILLIDVAHVYSTLYRTYFDKEMLKNSKTILYAIPLVSLLVSVLVYNMSSLWFWRIMAYLAVFHFIRQQYGFMRLYSRNEQNSKFIMWLDKVVIYYATIYPIVFWHFNPDRSFSWFIDGDFITTNNETIIYCCTIAYWIILSIFLLTYLYIFIAKKIINIPKLLVIIGTIVSWYFGIIYYNGDITFTLLNVVSHGIPYMALIWIYSYKKQQKKPLFSTSINKKVFSKYGIILFVLIIFLLAYIEEGLWDGLVWNEHKRIFHLFSQQLIHPSHHLLSFIVPLLALPQITHYVIDGFIWKVSKDK